MSSIPGQIKAIDEPLFRVFLRLRAARFLWLAAVFQRLAQKDEGGAFSLAGRLERPELKASAMLGTLMGLPDIEAKADAEQPDHTQKQRPF